MTQESHPERAPFEAWWNTKLSSGMTPLDIAFGMHVERCAEIAHGAPAGFKLVPIEPDAVYYFGDGFPRPEIRQQATNVLAVLDALAARSSSVEAVAGFEEPARPFIDAAMDVARYEYGHGVTRASIVAIWKALGSPSHYAAPQAGASAGEAKLTSAQVKTRMEFAESTVKKLPVLDPTFAIEEILSSYPEGDDRDEVLWSIRAYADMRANQAIFSLYPALATASSREEKDDGR